MHGSEPQPIDAWVRETDRDDERRFRCLSEAMTNRDEIAGG